MEEITKDIARLTEKAKLLTAQAEELVAETNRLKGKLHKGKTCPPRYFVYRPNPDNNYALFYAGSRDGKPLYSDRPCLAVPFVKRKEAEAVIDFLDSSLDGWQVYDRFPQMSAEERLLRAILADSDSDDSTYDDEV